MTEPLRMPPDEYELVKGLALKVSPDLEFTPEELAGLRAALGAAIALPGWRLRQLPALAPAMPVNFAGSIAIEWPPPGDALPGHKIRIFDAADGSQIMTISDLTVHASADGVVWAECVMFADENGNPLPKGGGVLAGGEVLTGTFAFRVAGMRVTPVLPRHPDRGKVS